MKRKVFLAIAFVILAAIGYHFRQPAGIRQNLLKPQFRQGARLCYSDSGKWYDVETLPFGYKLHLVDMAGEPKYKQYFQCPPEAE